MRKELMKKFGEDKDTADHLDRYNSALSLVEDYLPSAEILSYIQRSGKLLVEFQNTPYFLWRAEDGKWCGTVIEREIEEGRKRKTLRDLCEYADTLSAYNAKFFADDLKEAAFALVVFIYAEHDQELFCEMMKKMALKI